MPSTWSTVLLFPETYPFRGPDDPFLPAEVEVLAQGCDLHLIPSIAISDRVGQIPDGVHFDPRLAAASNTRLPALIRALLSPSLYAEIATQAPSSLKPRALATIAARLARAITVERWVRREVLPNLAGSVVLYSWWSAAYAVGIARALRGTGIPLVTRAHGFDLYAEQEAVGFVPFQHFLIGQAAQVLSVSQAGTDYLKRAYPLQAERIATSYLGIKGQPEQSHSSTDGVLRIVSCSGLVEVKRIDLLARALAHLAEQEPSLNFTWTHLGGGPLLGEIQELTAVPALAGRCLATGELEPDEVKSWLDSHEVDLFINVSRSEGLPVSLMEAASFGIPMMATAVGGNPEIVDASCGALLPADPVPNQVAEAIRDFAALTSEQRLILRQGARRVFEERFDAARNYQAVLDLLMEQAHHR